MKYIIAMLAIIFMADIGTCLGVDGSICNPGDIN